MTMKNENGQAISVNGLGTPTSNLKSMQVVASQTMLWAFLFDK